MEQLVNCVKRVFHFPSEAFFRAFAARPPMLHYKWLEVGREMRTYSFDCYRQLVAHVKTLPPLPASVALPKPIAVKRNNNTGQQLSRPSPGTKKITTDLKDQRPTLHVASGAAERASVFDRVAAGAHELMVSLASLLQRIPHVGKVWYTSPWVDKYLDEVLVRAVFLRFGQCPQYQLVGKAAQADVQTKWLNVSVLLSRSVGHCMVRYLELLMRRLRGIAADRERSMQQQLAQPASSSSWQGSAAASASAQLPDALEQTGPSLLSLGVTSSVLNPEGFATSCAVVDAQKIRAKVVPIPKSFPYFPAHYDLLCYV
jgi:hypothetical protein